MIVHDNAHGDAFSAYTIDGRTKKLAFHFGAHSEFKRRLS